ncbi:MAG: hypothetical protein A2474_07210 [Elusimicrobia bacterium RIFOXYC2_FULL_34_12]|nr:MAG: hypothetical protein A2474_07210 [Elusimicrobia bacterium RIFOXYC2_FULL_34_12]OGS39454.1 MAG: hypothetical protein A2551_01200 [Elusimicrobia bacterium RIFOXYD2_FULL_34_30]HAM39424.1 hypothetical protein [Elusimicrobiota bacterium]
MKKVNLYLINIILFLTGFNCSILFSQEVNKLNISANDIAVMNLKDSFVEISSSIANIKTSIKMSDDLSNTITEKMFNIEKKIIELNKNMEEISLINNRIANVEDNNKKEVLILKDSIKSNEDALKIILNDIHYLREKINTDKKPVINNKKQVKEYVPYIAMGVSLLSFIIAVSH